MPERVREAVRLERMVALKVEQRVDEPAAGRIALGHGEKVGAEDIPEAWVGAEDLVEGLMQEPGVDGMLKPLRQAMTDSVLETRLAQDRREDQAREHRLLRARLFGLTPHLVPDRIDRTPTSSPLSRPSPPPSPPPTPPLPLQNPAIGRSHFGSETKAFHSQID